MEPCQKCTGEYIPGHISKLYEFDDDILVVRKIPALVCDSCGDYLIESRIMYNLDEIKNQFKKMRSKIQVVEYNDAA